MLDGFALKRGHLLIMFFCNLLGSFLIFTFACDEPSDALSLSSSRARSPLAAPLAPSRPCSPRREAGVGIFVAEKNDFSAGFGRVVCRIPGTHGVSHQHQVGGLRADIVGQI